MEYPIIYQGAEVGTLTVSEDGLYWQFSAWTEPFAEGVQRLFGCYGDASVCFGVFAPAGKALSLHRRLSRRAFPDLPKRWTAGRECGGFLPWSGEVEGQQVADAMRKAQPDGALLALPADRDPIPLAEYAPQMSAITLDGRAYLCLLLRDGVPAVPDPSEEITQAAPGEEDVPAAPAAEDAFAAPAAEQPQISSTSSTGQ